MAAGAPVSGTGVRWVLVQHNAGGTVPASALVGLQLVYSGPHLDLYANPAVAPDRPVDRSRRWLVAGVDLAVAALVIAAVLCLGRMLTRW
jgi:hypothetical protein